MSILNKKAEKTDEISYEKFLYMPKIIKVELINRHFNNILTGSLKLKRPVDWSKILLAIIMTFKLLQCSIECLFLPIRKAAATIHIFLLWSTHKDNILYHKVVKIMINALGFAEVIYNVVICHHCLLGSVVTNSGSFFFFKTWHCYITSTTFYLQTSGPTKMPNNS